MRRASKPIAPSRDRSNRPSGRQASEQPEHKGKANADPSTLHQGQGPDFQTQDSTLSNYNEGVQQLKKEQAYPSSHKPRKSPLPNNPIENPDRTDEQPMELPGKGREHKQYTEDNPKKK